MLLTELKDDEDNNSDTQNEKDQADEIINTGRTFSHYDSSFPQKRFPEA
jgi:hypothetical protein